MYGTLFPSPTVRIGAAVSKRAPILVSCLVLLATACGGGLPKTDVDLGSGRRFVPQVVDSITNVGVSPSVALDADGNPVIAYLGYPSVPKAGEIPETRPVTLPLVPAVMYATEKDGAWTVRSSAVPILSSRPGARLPSARPARAGLHRTAIRLRNSAPLR